MQTIDWIHAVTSIMFLVASVHKLYKRQPEHYFTRFLVAIWFALTVVNRDMPVQFVREMSNYVVMLVPTIEILSPAFLKYFKGKR